MKEGPKQKKALNYYYSLGNSRTYAKVAKEFSVRIETICRWVKIFDWKQKIEKRNGTIEDLVTKLFDIEVSELKSRLATMFMKDLIKAQEKSIESHFDKRETTKLVMGLLGEPTEIAKLSIETISMSVNFIVDIMEKHVTPEVFKTINDELGAKLEEMQPV